MQVMVFSAHPDLCTREPLQSAASLERRPAMSCTCACFILHGRPSASVYLHMLRTVLFNAICLKFDYLLRSCLPGGSHKGPR